MFIIAYVIYGDQPKVGASADELVSFYDGDRTRILIASVLFGGAVLFLLWFAAAIASTLRDAGQGGWGAAATASSAALAAVFFVLIIVGAALAHSIAGSGDDTITSGLNDLAWACVVMVSFPAAMLIMAGTFGLWRAGLISNALFWAGLAAVVLVLLGGTTWASDGIWAPDGAYLRFIAPIVGLAWVRSSAASSSLGVPRRRARLSAQACLHRRPLPKRVAHAATVAACATSSRLPLGARQPEALAKGGLELLQAASTERPRLRGVCRAL